MLLWATMGLAWNMLSGYSGLISFGHAVFFGLGGYTMTIVFVKYGLTPGSAFRSASSSACSPAS